MAESIPLKIMLCLAFPDNPYQDDYGLEEYARYAFEKAVRMAKKTGASIHLLAIIEPYHYSHDEIAAEFESKRQERTRDAVQALANDLEKAGIEHTTEVDDGIAWFEIIKHSIWSNADWIMLSATRKGTSTDGSVLGSTARKVVRKSAIPVWVVQDTPAKTIESIAISVDLTAVSEKITRVGLQLAELLDAKAKMVHSVDYSGELAFFRYSDAEARQQEYRKSVRENAREHMRKLAGDKADDVEILISEHNITTVLPQMVDNGDAQMVVMGSISRSGIAGFIVGNRAEKLLDQLKCSLLVLKPDDWANPLDLDADQ